MRSKTHSELKKIADDFPSADDIAPNSLSVQPEIRDSIAFNVSHSNL